MRDFVRLPLDRLVTPHGQAARIGDLGREAIRQLLRGGPVRFVVADLASGLRWVPGEERFRFWKEEVQPHLVEPGASVVLEDGPGEYAYFAARWDDAAGPVVVLSLHH
jgi:hypothetical protein